MSNLPRWQETFAASPKGLGTTCHSRVLGPLDKVLTEKNECPKLTGSSGHFARSEPMRLGRSWPKPPRK